MEKIWIRDKHPGSATLLFGININTFRYLRGSSETRGQLFHSREQNSPQAGTRNMIRRCLKGQCHKIYILISSFFVCADGFQGLTKSFTTHTIINFLFASLRLLTNFENVY
jgi:hypothetical protein